MKTKITITLITVLMFISVGFFINGLNNYKNAIEASKKCNGSDLQIVLCMKYYGFDLDINESPEFLDYIKSNFK